MNTAQVSVELVLAGILALCSFVLPFLDRSDLRADLLQNEALIGVLGLSYMLGVLFDKLADTLLGPREHYMRLKQAGTFLDRNPDFKGDDPFPQDDLEYLLKKAKDGRLDWMNALKSRIRTSRELAVLGLPATVGILVHLATASPWMYVPVALNLLVFFLPIWRSLRPSKKRSQKSSRVEQVRIRTDGIHRNQEDRKGQFVNLRKQMHIESIPYYLLLAFSTITAVTLAIPNLENPWISLIGAGGLILSLLAWWTCERIMGTYFEFIAREMSVNPDRKGK